MANISNIALDYLDSSLNQAEKYLQAACDCANNITRLESLRKELPGHERGLITEMSHNLENVIHVAESLFEETLQRLDPTQSDYQVAGNFASSTVKRQAAHRRLEAIRQRVTLARYPNIDARKAGFIAPEGLESLG